MLSNAMPNKSVTNTQYALSWIQILVFPFVMWSSYIFYPMQKPEKGLANNWVSFPKAIM